MFWCEESADFWEKQEIYLILLADGLNNIIYHLFPPVPRCLGAFFPRGLQAVLPHSDELHVRCCETRHPSAAGLRALPVAAARRGRHRDSSVVRRFWATQRSGAAARPAHPRRAAHQWQGTASVRALDICTCVLSIFQRINISWSMGHISKYLLIKVLTCIIKSILTFQSLSIITVHVLPL